MKNISNDPDIVVVHDGVRPLIKSSIISESIKIAQEKGACMARRGFRHGKRQSGIECEEDRQGGRGHVQALPT